MREPPLDHQVALTFLGQGCEQSRDTAMYIGERQTFRQAGEVVDPLGCEAEELQGELRMFGETRAEARPWHHDEGGWRERHGGPHVWGLLDQPQIAKRLPESGHAESEFLAAVGAGIHPDAAAEYHVAGGARSAGVDQYRIFLIDFDPTIGGKQFDGGGRRFSGRGMFTGWQQGLWPRGSPHTAICLQAPGITWAYPRMG